MEKDTQQEQEKTKVLEVQNQMLVTIMRNHMIDDNNNKNKINELKGD